ncbi:MAG: DsbA family oxidoreductase [Bacteroidetes bacterium]|nr:DsbA family oxidoreductase [Bacteroidota bacterium]
MKIEIWSDIMCPFCYIGKRRLETALAKFENKEHVEIIWKSYMLNPTMKTDTGKNINRYLAEIKGWSIEQAKEMNTHVTNMAKEVGLTYDFDKAIVANSLKAHCLIQLAKTKNKGNEIEEHLFKAYFTEGKNVDDEKTLVELGKEIGLEESEVRLALRDLNYLSEVDKDIREAQQIGVRGVPFFVIDRKYGISGAQPESIFTETLAKAWAENN